MRRRYEMNPRHEPVIAEIPPAPDWSIYLAIDSSPVRELPASWT